jgi:protein-disulfide isomerase
MAYRADLLIAGAPVKGSDNARVTIVKFEDFQCPFCKQIQPIFTDLLTRYSGKVRLVHKDLPLDSIHPLARQGAEAARCADEQGKFWVYHDMLYERSPKLGLDNLKSYAKELGLNQSLFSDCLGSGKVKVAVQQDLSEGAQLGITGTPTFFINGRELSGVQPIEAIVELIEAELSQQG